MKGFATPPERVLVKAVNWLGDAVMTMPALRAVRAAYPQARLAVLVKRELAGFYSGAGWIDEVIPYRVLQGLPGIADRRRIVAGLRARRFDLAVLFPKSFQAALWTFLARIPRRVGFATDWRSALLTDRVPFDSALRERHQLYDYLHLLERGLGITGRAADCALDVHEQHRVRLEDWLKERRQRPERRLIALAAAAAYGPAKEWPERHYAELIDLLAERHGAECVLLGAPSEVEKSERVARASRAGAVVAAGETDIAGAMALLSLCDGFAGNDSGSMHVAGALGIPTVGIFGSTNPDRTGPLGPRVRVLYEHIACSPCLDRTCRFGHYDCLTRITPTAVAAALEELGAFN